MRLPSSLIIVFSTSEISSIKIFIYKVSDAVIEEDDQNEFHRYQLKDVAFIAFRPDFKRIGVISSIDKDGLVFDYLDYGLTDAEINQMDKGFPLEVDMFLKDSKFYLSCVPCRVVSYHRGGCSSYTGIYHSQNTCCRIEFGNLSRAQRIQLEYFLKHHTYCVEDSSEDLYYDR